MVRWEVQELSCGQGGTILGENQPVGKIVIMGVEGSHPHVWNLPVGVEGSHLLGYATYN